MRKIRGSATVAQRPKGVEDGEHQQAGQQAAEQVERAATHCQSEEEEPALGA